MAFVAVATVLALGVIAPVGVVAASERSVRTKVRSGVTEGTRDDVAAANGGATGYLKICTKVPIGIAPAALFSFTVGAKRVKLRGACSAAVTVFAGPTGGAGRDVRGPLVVHESPVAGFAMTGCSTVPATDLLGCNRGLGSAVVKVAPGPISSETIVTFTNAAVAGNNWVHELGSAGDDEGLGIAVDRAGNTYITGFTTGQLPDSPEANAGGNDAFVAKYAPSGTRLWVRQLGSAGNDEALGIAVDHAENAYVTGFATAQLPGSPDANFGGEDAFVAKYNSAGNRLWVRQLGIGAYAVAYGIAVDSAANAYITGATTDQLSGPNAGGSDVFVAKYSSSGSRLWVQQIGSRSDDEGQQIAVDGAGNAYITGTTAGQLPGSPEANAGGQDVFVAKYNAAGDPLWVHQLGSIDNDLGFAVAVDPSGNSYLTGTTNGQLPGSVATNTGGEDIFIAKYDTAGNRRWVDQLGSAANDRGYGVAVDRSGNAYIAGATWGHIPGAPNTNAGQSDVFVAKYDTTGKRLWADQVGSWGDDEGRGIATDNAHVYVSGFTNGQLPGAPETNAGSYDVFVGRDP